MRVRHFAILLGATSAFVFGAACSSSSSSDDSSATSSDAGSGTDATIPGADGGGGSNDSGGGGGCASTLVDGTYKIHYSGGDAAVPGCPPPDSTVTLPTPVADAGKFDAGKPKDAGPSPCSSVDDTATCTTTTTCEVPLAKGDRDKSIHVETISADGTSAAGTYTNVVSYADGGIEYACTGVAITWTKQ